MVSLREEKKPIREHIISLLQHPTVIFLITLFIAMHLELNVLPLVPQGDWKDILEHTSVALMVGSFLGLTYEYVLHRQREETLRQIIDDHRTKVFDSLKAYMLLTPEEIFGLLRDIACQTDEIPTLYVPPRVRGKEYTFARSVRYFDTLVDVRRKEITDVLRSWITPDNHPNVKFLASDFVGMYELHDLAGDLRRYADETIASVDRLEDADLGWVLNYVWASSRCEKERYGRLKELLCNTEDERIQEWILFVPLQMPDPEFVGIIQAYLLRTAPISERSLKQVVRAVALLEYVGKCQGAEIFRESPERFQSEELRKEIDSAWRNWGRNPTPIIKILQV